MLKLWKATITFALFVLLLFLASPRFMPKTLWVVLMVVTLSYGISLFFSTDIPAYRRWGIAYLVFVGLSYFLAGIFGVRPTGDLIAAAAWYSLISPYPLFSLLGKCVKSYPCSIYEISYGMIPDSDQDFQLFSIMVIVISLTSIVAALAMAKNKAIAYTVWLALVGLSVLAALAYVAAEFANWGMILHTESVSKATIISLCWSASYVIAYVMARTGADI